MCKEDKKQKIKSFILENREISPGIYKMVVASNRIETTAKPGQFVNFYCKEGSRLLPRPISICEMDKQNNTLTFVYGVVGKGTEEFSNMKSGEYVDILGPLGNGYEIDENINEHIIIGGGIGIPPLLELVKELKGTKKVYLGFRTGSFLAEEFEKHGAEVYVATDDGSYGLKGTVVDLLKETKEGLRLLNFARGGLVNYDALENAIEEGIIANYITDFPNERLLKMKNVINIPHLGASTPESEENCAEMAINSLKEYLENGNIVNSVNYPDCDMGVCEAENRITVNHANVKNMLGQITKVLGDHDINISVMTNKHRGPWAYTMIDVDSNIGEDVKTALKAIEGVTRVRILK